MPTTSRRRYTTPADSTSYQREPANFRAIDTVIVGNGPAALFLSFLLHGHVPRYDAATFGPHPDPVLHAKLGPSKAAPLYDLLDSPQAIARLTEHFGAAPQRSYSDQALPVNVLLDTLLRPHADSQPGHARLRWDRQPARRVDHMVLGSAADTGGQWADEPVPAAPDIRTLSYADMFSLPGYSFADHYARLHAGRALPELVRPTRRDVAAYYAAYPHAVGIASAIYCGTTAQRISRNSHGLFTVRVQRCANKYPAAQAQAAEPIVVVCRHLVLATGIFTYSIPPPPIFLPLLQRAPQLPQPRPPAAPVLVIGSGFTAADVILSQPPDRRIIHIYKWHAARPSPLKACHPDAYPDYAQIYRQMKLATTTRRPSYESQLDARPPHQQHRRPSLPGSRQHQLQPQSRQHQQQRRQPDKDSVRDWDATYEGFPNSQVVGVHPDGRIIILTPTTTTTTTTATPSVNNCYQQEVEIEIEVEVERTVSSLEYCTGRKGSLGYLSADLRREVGVMDAAWVSADTMRRRVEADLEVSPGVFVVGSLTGDSLVRFGLGSGVYAAGRILRDVDRDRPAAPDAPDSSADRGRWGGCCIA